MAEQSWWKRAIATINREYERRIRRSSLVTEYGANHHGHGHDADHDQPDHGEHDDGEASVIMNVPKGTRLGPHASTAHPPEDHSSSE